MDRRAERPLPPTKVAFDGVEFQTVFDNTAPIVVTWKRRNRLTDTVLSPLAADEALTDGTEYWIEHGPSVYKYQQLLGTGTTGSFNFFFSGANTFSIFAKKGGLESTRLNLNVTATHGNGVIASGAIAGASASIGNGSVSAIAGNVPWKYNLCGWGIIGNASGSIPGITASPPQATAQVIIVGYGDLPSITYSGPTGTLTHQPVVEGFGVLGGITLSPPAASFTFIPDAVGYGALPTITFVKPTGTLTYTIDAIASGSFPSVTFTGATGAASSISIGYGAFPAITVSPVTGSASSGGSEYDGTIPTIYLKQLDGIAFSFTDVGSQLRLTSFYNEILSSGISGELRLTSFYNEILSSGISGELRLTSHYIEVIRDYP